MIACAARAAAPSTSICSASPFPLRPAAFPSGSRKRTRPGSTVPTGSVNFYDGQTLLGSAALNGQGGATFSTRLITVDATPC